MSTVRVAVTLEKETLDDLDRLVKNRVFENRSRAIQVAASETLERIGRNRLARECAKLNREFEQALAEEGITGSPQ